MKKIYFSFVGIAVVALAVIASCTKEIENNDKDGVGKRMTELTIEDAQAFFEGFVTEFEVFPYTTALQVRNGDRVPTITPIWKNACHVTYRGNSMIESPLNTPIGCVLSTPSQNERIPDEYKYMNTITRLLMGVDEHGDIFSYIIRYSADISYLRKHHKQFRHITLNDLVDFTGKIRCYSLSGKLINGLVYEVGKIMATIQKDSDNSLSPQTPFSIPKSRGSQFCYLDYTYLGEECFCVEEYDDEGEIEDEYEHCIDFYEVEYICEDDDDDGGGGGDDNWGGGSDDDWGLDIGILCSTCNIYTIGNGAEDIYCKKCGKFLW